MTTLSREHQRLADAEARRADWKQWGPYLSERAWGTVREDYSADAQPWQSFTHDHARSRVYRWNEDGLGGFCNRFQNICLSVALWNEHDPIIKERLFGLTGDEGNHGESVKEHYFYLDGVPSHAYMKMLYKYPQVAYPYKELISESQRRSRREPEVSLHDVLPKIFEEGRYFDVLIEYAKADQQDILCLISVTNRGPQSAPVHVLPHIWFRNTWSWGYDRPRPQLVALPDEAPRGAWVSQSRLGERYWYVASSSGDERLLFTDNETNRERLWGVKNTTPYVKDGINDYLTQARQNAVNPEPRGSKLAAHVVATLGPGETLSTRVRFRAEPSHQPFDAFDAIMTERRSECDAFYNAIQAKQLSQDERRIQRQAYAGLLWNKQFYHYAVDLWLKGDPAGPPPPQSRLQGRNTQWSHLYNLDVISMPDKWEYPWYAAWDLAFHCVPLSEIDPEWAKRQLILLLREWYMHPNGQLPAYEWQFSDVNPPVHAWAAWRVYKITRNVTGKADTKFLERVFHKCLLNFTWWVNRTDRDGRNIFQGGFLGLDNIGPFDRSAPPPLGGHLEQADGTAWMAMYCLNMLAIALELARTRPAYEDVATKFFEHFIYIAYAINRSCGDAGLWDETDGFYYDMLHSSDGSYRPIKLRSMAGLIPLFAVETLEPEHLEKLPRFRRRMEWFMRYRQHLVEPIASLSETGDADRRLLSLLDATRLKRVLSRVLDPKRFLSDYGIRSMSKEHATKPYTLEANGQQIRVSYEPAESSSGLFGGNSNWRGPIWFPLNYLLIESLQKYHHYYGDTLKVELPQGSGKLSSLDGVAAELSERLIALFGSDDNGRRPFHGTRAGFQRDEHWRDQLLFHEYFHGDTGAGLGASHQTGWTALVAKLLQQRGRRR